MNCQVVSGGLLLAIGVSQWRVDIVMLDDE